MGFRFPVFWVRGFFFGFLGEVGQSALCFLVGRSSKFLQLSAGIQSCRGNLFNLIVIIIAYLPFYFLMVLNYYYHSVTIVNTVFWATKNFWFFSLFFLVFCKWYTVCSYKLGVLGPWEFLWRAGSCIYSVLVSLFCEIGGPVQFYLVTVVGWTAGLYRFSWFSGSISVGTVRVKRWGGDPIFLSSSVCCLFSWRLYICGRDLLCYIL